MFSNKKLKLTYDEGSEPHPPIVIPGCCPWQNRAAALH